jgi:hypothetical protein
MVGYALEIFASCIWGCVLTGGVLWSERIAVGYSLYVVVGKAKATIIWVNLQYRV